MKKTKFDGGSGFINNLIKEIEHVSSQVFVDDIIVKADGENNASQIANEVI